MSAGAQGLSVVVLIPDPARATERAEVLRYCDQCRRWGEEGSTHLCGKNWHDHLAPVLEARGRAKSSGRRS